MYKILIVEKCEDCPHLRRVYDNRYCGDTLKGERIDPSTITYPDWCPLDDGPHQADPADGDEAWVCPNCGFKNGGTWDYCSKCDEPRR